MARKSEIFKVRWTCGTAGEFQSELHLKLREMVKVSTILNTVTIKKEGADALFESKIFVAGGLSEEEIEALRIHFGEIEPSETMHPDYTEAV